MTLTFSARKEHFQLTITTLATCELFATNYCSIKSVFVKFLNFLLQNN